MDEKPFKLTGLQIAFVVRLIVSSAILTGLLLWVLVWPPQEWTIPAVIIGVCLFSMIAMNTLMAIKARRDRQP